MTGNSIYSDLKKAAEDKSIWRTLRRDCHRTPKWANHWKRREKHQIYTL